MNVEQLRKQLRETLDAEDISLSEWSRLHDVNKSLVSQFLNGADPKPSLLAAMGYEEIKHEKKYRLRGK